MAGTVNIKKPLDSTGVPLTAVHDAGDRFKVCCRKKLPPLLVQESEIWPELVPTEVIPTGGTGTIGIHAENSEVLFAGSVAVAVTTQFVGTATGSVTVKFDEHMFPSLKLDHPRNIWPSP